MNKKIKIVLGIVITLVIIAGFVGLGLLTVKYYKGYKELQDIKAEEVRIYEERLAKESEEERIKKERQLFLEQNVLDNNIPIGLYTRQGGEYVLTDTWYCDWSRDSIFSLFYALPSNERAIASYNFKDTFKTLWAQNNTEGYKIGYTLRLKLDTGEEINRTMLDPIYVNDDIFSHIQLYFYDDVTEMPGRRYYHMSPEEMLDESLLTSIKLVGYKETKGVNGPIEVTVFTYNGPEDFDETTGEYIGNSKFTLKIYREQI